MFIVLPPSGDQKLTLQVVQVLLHNTVENVLHTNWDLNRLCVDSYEHTILRLLTKSHNTHDKLTND